MSNKNKIIMIIIVIIGLCLDLVMTFGFLFGCFIYEVTIQLQKPKLSPQAVQVLIYYYKWDIYKQYAYPEKNTEVLREWNQLYFDLPVEQRKALNEKIIEL